MPLNYPVGQFIFDLLSTFRDFLPYVLAAGIVIGALNWLVGAFINIFRFRGL